MNNTFISGEWNVVCDLCGFRYKASSLKKRWDGLMVCEKDFEMRNPQDLIRLPKEEQGVPWSRPLPQDQFVSITWYTGGTQDTTKPSGTFNPNQL